MRRQRLIRLAWQSSERRRRRLGALDVELRVSPGRLSELRLLRILPTVGPRRVRVKVARVPERLERRPRW